MSFFMQGTVSHRNGTAPLRCHAASRPLGDTFRYYSNAKIWSDDDFKFLHMIPAPKEQVDRCTSIPGCLRPLCLVANGSACAPLQWSSPCPCMPARLLSPDSGLLPPVRLPVVSPMASHAVPHSPALIKFVSTPSHCSPDPLTASLTILL